MPLASAQKLREKCPYSEFFWSAFSRIQTECGEIRSISPYSVRLRENTDQKISEYGHFSRSVRLLSIISGSIKKVVCCSRKFRRGLYSGFQVKESERTAGNSALKKVTISYNCANIKRKYVELNSNKSKQ